MRTSEFRRPVGQKKGRPLDSEAQKAVARLLGDRERRPDLLIEYLHLIQDELKCLPVEYLHALANELRLSQTEVFEVATFYHHFDVVKGTDERPPQLTVRVCDSLSCAMAGAEELLTQLEQHVSRFAEPVRVQRVPCVGRCEQAPVAVVDQFPVPRATADSVAAAVGQRHRACPVPSEAKRLAAARKDGAYSTLLGLIADERTPERMEALYKRLESANLRGLGGAGFPTGRKWRIVAGFSGERLMAINGDEGEPGTFKDRHYLEREPHRFLEGMLIAAWAVGCSKVYIYLRDEYPGVRQLLIEELAALRALAPEFRAASFQGRAGQEGWTMPSIELRRGAGAYICGEESGMLESIEGKRGMPRLRPPYIAEVGLFGKPTLAHNIETLMWVPTILSQGDEAFAAHGRRGRKGLRSFSVSGRVRDPGVKLAPAGISLRELIDEYCGGMLEGHALYGYLPGGASGGILPASLADEPMDFDTLQKHGCFIGSAAVVVLSDRDRARDAARNVMEFFHHESCGQCTPCRVGTAKAAALMSADQWDEPLMRELSTTMIDASICGLGQAAPNPLLSVLKFFPSEVK